MATVIVDGNVVEKKMKKNEALNWASLLEMFFPGSKVVVK